MIGTGRRVNDFDNFMNPNQFASPRQCPLNNIQNYSSNQERHHSPNRINNTRKPMISPVRSPRPQPKVQQMDRSERLCSNETHPQKKADYFIRIEGEDMYYCEKCATQAASQGFTVKRLQSQSNYQSKKGRKMPDYPKYIGNERYHELTNLLKGIITLENDYKAIDTRRVSEHYKKQEEMLNSFYDNLISLVQRMRGDHLNDLEAEGKKNEQVEAFRLDHLRTHIQDLSDTWNDIEGNVESIVVDVDQVDYERCMKEYHNKLQIFSHKLEEFQEQQDSFTTYSQMALSRKVKNFEELLLDLWNEEDQQKTMKMIPEPKRQTERQGQHSDRFTTIKNVHEMLPRQEFNQNAEGQGAFRNLFPQEESEERLPETSPQFKAF